MAKRSPLLEARRSELIILLILMEQQCSGYEIRAMIHDWHIDRFLPVSATTIYRALQRLADDGCLLGKSHKSGKYPVSIVYAITDKGKERYREHILAESGFNRTGYSLDAFLGLASYLDENIRIRVVRDWQTSAEKRIEELNILIDDRVHGPGHTYGKPYSEWLLLDHERDMLKAEMIWMEKFTKITRNNVPRSE